jgi:hypothetical protein
MSAMINRSVDCFSARRGVGPLGTALFGAPLGGRFFLIIY